MHLLVRSSVLFAILAFATGACGGSDAPAAPEVTAVALTANTSTTLSGTVGAAVGSAPAVKVVGSNGQPFGGATVTFLASGGGTVGESSVTTNASGIASAGSWTLGTTAGSQTVTASASGLGSVTFTAAAAAGVAAMMTANGGDAQQASVGAAVATAPSVRVNDAHGNVVPNVAVAFAATAGGGQVLGGNATTNVQGVATAGGWIMGSAAGANTLTATVASLTPVTFTATSTVCCGVAHRARVR